MSVRRHLERAVDFPRNGTLWVRKWAREHHRQLDSYDSPMQHRTKIGGALKRKPIREADKRVYLSDKCLGPTVKQHYV
uniref:Uncharacterized protein n=1 Tax=Timema cristinae TaxID=61476 RepID=A0A7R9DFE5_TIMCR|nr:unnamed protein product [Timema cristinae]